MPYKDLERKKEWERLHRPERLARRRELRRIAAAQEPTRPDATQEANRESGFVIPLIAGGALAAYNPKLGMGVGALTLVAARGTLEYRISDLGKARLRWLRTQRNC